MATVGLVAGCASAVASLAAAGVSRTTVRVGRADRRILAVALGAAVRAGDPTPTLIQHSAGSRRAANRVASGERGGGGQRSYLIAERGHFVLTDVGIGNQTIRGSVITLVCDARTLSCTDFGLQNNYPDLAALGPGVTDSSVRLRSARAVGGSRDTAPRVATVPRVVGLAPVAAYRRLHRRGLLVTMPATTIDYGVDLSPYVMRSSPAHGTRVARGSVVRLALGCPGCGAGSPGVPNHVPRYRVPRFVGRQVNVPYRWVIDKTLYFTAHLGRLVRGDARDLFANYRVGRQSPRPGSVLTLGRGHSCCHGTGGSFQPTPLVVWGSQTGRIADR